MSDKLVMKRTSYFFLFVVSVLFSQCSGSGNVVPIVDFDKASIRLVSELEPQDLKTR